MFRHRTTTLPLFLLLALVRPAQSSVRLEVIGIEGDLHENVRLFVGESPGSDPLVVRRHAEGASGKAREALEALGYYEATIRASAPLEKGVRVIRLEIDPGLPVRIAELSLEVTGEAGQDPAFAELLRKMPLRQGEILHHGRYEAAKRQIERLALAQGYFDGRFVRHEIRIDRARRQAHIVLHYDGGRRFRLGPVRLSETPLSEALLLRLIPFREGDPYRSESVSALHRNLLRSEYFEEIRVRPRVEEAGDDLEVPIDVELHPSPRNRMGVGVGAATDTGPRVRLEWRRPWINRRGHSALLKSETSLVRQDVSGQYSIPLNPPLDHQLQFSTGWQREDIEDTERNTLRAGVQRRRLHENGWQHNLFLRWEQERFTQADVQATTSLTLPGISLGRTRRRGGTIPTRGDRLFGVVEAAHPDLLFSDLRLVRMLLQAKRLDTWGSHSLSGRIEYGAMDTDDFEHTPPSLRFFAGGDHSVRGFGYHSLSPRNESGELVGGRHLLTSSLEYNLRLARQWKAAAFFDLGNASGDNRFSDGFARGAGFGVRWLSPLAPVRLDFAWGVSEPDPPFRIHFSMGADL